MHRKTGRRFVGLGFLGTVLILASIAGPVTLANAIPGGPWASSSSPLTVDYAGWTPVGSVYGTWQGYREDEGRGSRVQDSSAAKTRNTYEAGMYTKHTWYWDGSYCYISSYSNGGVSAACTTGWHQDGTTNSVSNNTTTYKYSETWYSADPEALSARGKMQACFNVKLAPDKCSKNYFVRGSEY